MTPPPTFTQSRWSLSDLFPAPDSPELQAAFDAVDAAVTEFEGQRELLVSDISIDAFLGIVHKYEHISELNSRLYAFAGLWFTEDTQNQDAQSLQARVQQAMAELGNRTLFFNLWWKDLDDAAAGRLMDAAGDYRYWLEKMRYFKPHTLTEAEEKIINIKDVTGSRALETLYDAITNRYVFKLEIDGVEKELTRGELMVHVRSTDPDLRAAAYQEQYKVYGEDAPILGQIYQALVRDWRNEQIDLRHFENPIAVRNLHNDIPDDVVDTLLDVAQENAVVFQRFFKLKARWLGMDRLRRYDIYAPVVESDKTYNYADAADMVLDAFQDFEPVIARLGAAGFRG